MIHMHMQHNLHRLGIAAFSVRKINLFVLPLKLEQHCQHRTFASLWSV